MPGYSDYYYGEARSRRGRRRNTRGRLEEGDAIVAAITLQVIICVILIVAFAVYKKINEEGYQNLKSEYAVMASGSGEADMGEAFAEAAESISGAFKAMEDALIRFFTGGSVGGAVSMEESEADTPPESAVTETPAMGFGYNYLEKEAPVYTSVLSAGGAGGLFPVTKEAAGSAEAPPGSTFSPVVLGGYIKPPVTGLVTSVFGYRAHPVTEADDFHTGMDIAAVEGRAVLAALPGQVAEVGESAIYGNFIILQHADNLQTFYAHCSQIIAGEGMNIRQGERIAKVGQTGVATGPHLHFSVIVEGQFTDPYWVLKDNIELLD